jgi:hypothetical protein
LTASTCSLSIADSAALGLTVPYELLATVDEAIE